MTKDDCLKQLQCIEIDDFTAWLTKLALRSGGAKAPQKNPAAEEVIIDLASGDDDLPFLLYALTIGHEGINRAAETCLHIFHIDRHEWLEGVIAAVKI